MRAGRLHDADTAARVAKREEVLAEELDAHGRTIRLRQFAGEQGRYPVAPRGRPAASQLETAFARARWRLRPQPRRPSMCGGFIVVEGVRPDAAGDLSAAAFTALDDLAGDLGELSGETLHVVCHLYGSQSVEALTGAAERCAEAAARRLEEAAGVSVVAHGLGPIAPGGAGAVSRVEVVLPHRLPE